MSHVLWYCDNVYVQPFTGITGVVGFYVREELCHWKEFVNRSMEREAFIDSVWVECAQSKNKFLFEIFTAICVSVV